ncbi:unnamed protein product [Amoebophrya sp. A120]|nr:unnamed protein product [Amoebophrya sp. A120]|eukprot:GSA120T00002272001.1
MRGQAKHHVCLLDKKNLFIHQTQEVLFSSIVLFDLDAPEPEALTCIRSCISTSFSSLFSLFFPGSHHTVPLPWSRYKHEPLQQENTTKKSRELVNLASSSAVIVSLHHDLLV